MQRGGWGEQTETDSEADVSVSPCPTCIFKEQLCFLPLLLLHANYRKDGVSQEVHTLLACEGQ